MECLKPTHNCVPDLVIYDVLNFTVLFVPCVSMKSLSTSWSNTMHILTQASYIPKLEWEYNDCRGMCIVLDQLVDNMVVSYVVRAFPVPGLGPTLINPQRGLSVLTGVTNVN